VDTLTVWWDDGADGATNMAADECLAAEAERRGGLLVRFYGWTRTTVSLGAFQRLDDARRIPAIAGVPLVRRPSGGGAIVHGSDLTYAAAVPKTHAFGASPQAFYDALHGAMAEVVTGYGLALRPHAAADDTSPTVSAREAESFFCFDRRSTGDLVAPAHAAAGGRPPKLMGSAQRRLAAVVLQHGSFLGRTNADVAGPARHPSAADLCAVPLPSPYDLSQAWVGRIAHLLGVDVAVEHGGFMRGREADIAHRAAHFRDDRWTGRR
jgi:lipoate-protein ligase A